MQIRHVILKVSDQTKALAFYTEVLGFVKAQDRVGAHSMADGVVTERA
jgi:catechol 2,3-dioxygenase-like lactoylglutathione lyase family enzyme